MRTYVFNSSSSAEAGPSIMRVNVHNLPGKSIPRTNAVLVNSLSVYHQRDKTEKEDWLIDLLPQGGTSALMRECYR
jgi:hypothetical protein